MVPTVSRKSMRIGRRDADGGWIIGWVVHNPGLHLSPGRTTDDDPCMTGREHRAVRRGHRGCADRAARREADLPPDRLWWAAASLGGGQAPDRAGAGRGVDPAEARPWPVPALPGRAD